MGAGHHPHLAAFEGGAELIVQLNDPGAIGHVSSRPLFREAEGLEADALPLAGEHVDRQPAAIPHCAASSLSGAFDRCSATRMAYVVVVLPWSVCPIDPPGVSDQINGFLHTPGPDS